MFVNVCPMLQTASSLGQYLEQNEYRSMPCVLECKLPGSVPGTKLIQEYALCIRVQAPWVSTWNKTNTGVCPVY
ncbi:hypothetical protein XELAEV_18004877mg [Xenopus laevis]|uniref:Uncharacterized protein n=1 Tax=Xenopus laevis TaxID=8355 RepID=A0A974DXG7_XENLA|nr:hypothetical protein XELAEV_18004877mg [Xenopus laevis]